VELSSTIEVETTHASEDEFATDLTSDSPADPVVVKMKATLISSFKEAMDLPSDAAVKIKSVTFVDARRSLATRDARTRRLATVGANKKMVVEYEVTGLTQAASESVKDRVQDNASAVATEMAAEMNTLIAADSDLATAVQGTVVVDDTIPAVVVVVPNPAGMMVCPEEPTPKTTMRCNNIWGWDVSEGVPEALKSGITWTTVATGDNAGDMTCLIEGGASIDTAHAVCTLADKVVGGKEFSLVAVLTPTRGAVWNSEATEYQRHKDDRTTGDGTNGMSDGLTIQTYDTETLTNHTYTSPPVSTCTCIYKMSSYASAAALVTEAIGTDSFDQAQAKTAEKTLKSQATLTVTVAGTSNGAVDGVTRWEFKAVSNWSGNAIAASDCRAYDGNKNTNDVTYGDTSKPSYWETAHVTVGKGCDGTGVPAALDYKKKTINVASEHHWQVNKFGFVGGSHVTMVCLIEGVAYDNNCNGYTQNPGRRLLSEDADAAARGLDWTPFEGGMNSGPVTMEVGDDPNLMRFGYPEEKKKERATLARATQWLCFGGDFETDPDPLPPVFFGYGCRLGRRE